jgi:GTP cyclohydrolase I
MKDKPIVIADELQGAIRALLLYIGENPDREGLKETPTRVLRSYAELFSGYGKDPADALKVFEDGACDEMVILRRCEFHSVCEHHMQPFFGQAHIAYIPDKKVIGVSKLARILDIYARRLQIQERICQQVTTALDVHLKPKGSACILEATHFCMVCRGVQKQHSELVTSSLTGAFRQPEVRQELLALIRG